MIRQPFLLTLYVLLTSPVIAQGLIEMPKEEYEKLKSPPILSGATTLPTRYIIPLNNFPVPQSQGSQPSCTGWAVGYAFASFYQAAKRGWTPTTTDKIFSPSYIYQNIRECGSCECGTRIDKALEYMKDVGIVTMRDYPYNENDCSRPPTSLETLAKNYKISDYYRIDDIKNLREIKTYLSNDIPVMVSIKADNAFDAFYNKAENATLYWSGHEWGNHAVLVVGYDDSRAAFKIMNSWGLQWGNRGFGWIDYGAFRVMVNQGFIVEKDYKLANTPTIITKPQNATVTESDFTVYGSKEPIANNRFYFTFGLKTQPNIQSTIQKVVYVYDHPSFYNKYSTSTNRPYFTNSYEGWGCLSNMSAIIYFVNGTTITKHFSGCSVLDASQETGNGPIASFNLNPKVIAIPTGETNRYKFVIQLRGIEAVKDRVVRVVYDRNHPSFPQRFVTTTDSEKNFQHEYEGWGCLRRLGVTIYFDDNTTKSFSVDMCKQLGW